jgi:hypothetical protein
MIAGADGIFSVACAHRVFEDFEKIDQSIPIVAETEQILDHRNSPLNSRARFSDGSGIGFFGMRGKI